MDLSQGKRGASDSTGRRFDTRPLFSLDLASGIKSPILRGGMANLYLVGIGIAIWMMVRSVHDGRTDVVGAALLVGWMIPFAIYGYVRAVCRVRLSAQEIEIVTPVWTHCWALSDLAVVEMHERTLVVGRYIVIRRRTSKFRHAFFVGGLGIDFDALTSQFNEAAAAAMAATGETVTA